jgi:hypothetical protein
MAPQKLTISFVTCNISLRFFFVTTAIHAFLPISMNLVLLFPDYFLSDNQVRLYGRRREHILGVHKAEVGDKLTVGLVNGKMGLGLVTAANAGTIDLSVPLPLLPPGKNLPRQRLFPRPGHAAGSGKSQHAGQRVHPSNPQISD